MDARPTRACARWLGYGKGLGLQPHRQQPDRELDPIVGAWVVKLIVCWVAAQRQAGGGDHELDPIGTYEWA